MTQGISPVAEADTWQVSCTATNGSLQIEEMQQCNTNKQGLWFKLAQGRLCFVMPIGDANRAATSQCCVVCGKKPYRAALPVISQ